MEWMVWNPEMRREAEICLILRFNFIYYVLKHFLNTVKLINLKWQLDKLIPISFKLKNFIVGRSAGNESQVLLLICLHFWKMFSLGSELWAGGFFSFCSLNMSFHYALCLWFLLRNHLNSYCCPSKDNVSLPQGTFKIFSVYFVLSSLTIMWLIMIFCVFAWLGFSEIEVNY